MTLKNKIDKVVKKFGYICIKVEANIQGTLEIQLDKNLMLDKCERQLTDELKKAVYPFEIDDIYCESFN